MNWNDIDALKRQGEWMIQTRYVGACSIRYALALSSAEWALLSAPAVACGSLASGLATRESLGGWLYTVFAEPGRLGSLVFR